MRRCRCSAVLQQLHCLDHWPPASTVGAPPCPSSRLTSTCSPQLQAFNLSCLTRLVQGARSPPPTPVSLDFGPLAHIHTLWPPFSPCPPAGTQPAAHAGAHRGDHRPRAHRRLQGDWQDLRRHEAAGHGEEAGGGVLQAGGCYKQVGATGPPAPGRTAARLDPPSGLGTAGRCQLRGSAAFRSRTAARERVLWAGAEAGRRCGGWQNEQWERSCVFQGSAAGRGGQGPQCGPKGGHAVPSIPLLSN